MPRPTRESQALDRIDDIHGDLWLVREYRETEHGFRVALGWPVDGDGPSGATAIITQVLAEYLQAVERPRDIALPLGSSTIKRLRRALDLSFDWDAWWSARADDLHSMTLEQFCARHNCSMGAASQRRRQMANPA